MNKNIFYDLVVIGSGPGGYISAIRSSQLGLRTAIIEKNYQRLGGTCLNVGCIPSKCLLDSSKNFSFLKKDSLSHGIFYKNISFDLKKMMNRKNNIVNDINNGIKYLMKKNKIDIYYGIGSFSKNENIINLFYEKSNKKKKREIFFKNCIISTGSKPANFLNVNFSKRIISSTEAININEIPNKLITIGGGVIGLEISSIFNRLGSEVTIIENTNQIISNMDYSLGKEMKKILEKSNIKIYNLLKVEKIIEKEKSVIVLAKDNSNKELSFHGDYCLISTGRVPYTDELELQNLNIKKNENGFIIVDNNFKTVKNNVYAIGDVIGGKMLAHKSEEEGLYVAEYISGKKPNKINYNLIPSIIYTNPEISSVGYTEKEVKNNGIEYNIGIFPMKNLGRARASGCIDGFIKMISNKKTDEILGIHIVSDHASEIIMEAVISMEYKASSEDIYRICHPHPTFSESFKEVSMLNFENRSLHM